MYRLHKWIFLRPVWNSDKNHVYKPALGDCGKGYFGKVQLEKLEDQQIQEVLLLLHMIVIIVIVVSIVIIAIITLVNKDIIGNVI